MLSREYRRTWQAANRDHVREYERNYHARIAGTPLAERIRLSRTESKQRRKLLAFAFIDATRAGGCVDCGNKNLSVLQSDHVRGDKVANIGDMPGIFALSLLFVELDKCETRCANCHALATQMRRKTTRSHSL